MQMKGCVMKDPIGQKVAELELELNAWVKKEGYGVEGQSIYLEWKFKYEHNSPQAQLGFSLGERGWSAEITEQDWEKILSVPWCSQYKDILDVFLKHKNEPLDVNLLEKYSIRDSHLSLLNTRFKNYGLPYRTGRMYRAHKAIQIFKPPQGSQ